MLQQLVAWAFEPLDDLPAAPAKAPEPRDTRYGSEEEDPCAYMSVEDDYDPRDPALITPATEEEVERQNQELLDRQIQRLATASAKRVRVQPAVLDHYAQVLQDLRRKAGHGGIGHARRHSSAHIPAEARGAQSDLGLRRLRFQSVPANMAAFGQLPCAEDDDEAREGSFDEFSTQVIVNEVCDPAPKLPLVLPVGGCPPEDLQEDLGEDASPNAARHGARPFRQSCIRWLQQETSPSVSPLGRFNSSPALARPGDEAAAAEPEEDLFGLAAGDGEDSPRKLSLAAESTTDFSAADERRESFSEFEDLSERPAFQVATRSLVGPRGLATIGRVKSAPAFVLCDDEAGRETADDADDAAVRRPARRRSSADMLKEVLDAL